LVFRALYSRLIDRRENHLLEGEDVTTLGATSSKDATTALRAAANQEAMRTSTLDLRRLISTFGSHDYESLIKNALKISTKKKSIRPSKNWKKFTDPAPAFLMKTKNSHQ
jgi:hypothetical protein